MKAFGILMVLALISCACLGSSLAAQPDNKDSSYSSIYSLACDFLFAVRDKDTTQMMKLFSLPTDKDKMKESDSVASGKINDFFDILRHDKSQQLVIYLNTAQVETGQTIYKSMGGKVITKEDWEEEGNKIFAELSKKYGFEEIQRKAEESVSNEDHVREWDMLEKIWTEQDAMQIDPEPEMITVVNVTYEKGDVKKVIQVRNDNGCFYLKNTFLGY